MSKVNAKYIHYDTNTLDKDSNNALKVKDNVYEPVFSKNTAFNKNFGTGEGNVCEGNDSRLHTHSNKSALDTLVPTTPGKFLKVNTNGNGYEEADGIASGAEDFTDLNDVPSSYTGNENKLVKVKHTGDGLEFIAPDFIKYSINNQALSTLQKSNARTNLGLGNSAIKDVGMFSTQVAPGNHSHSSTGGLVQKTSGITNDLYDIVYANGLFVAVSLSGDILVSSDDGETWSQKTPGAIGSFYRIKYCNNTYIITGSSGIILTSTDAETWTSQTTGTSYALRDIAYGNGVYVAVGQNGTILTSTNLTSWTSRTSGTTNVLLGIIYANSKFVVCMQTSNVLYSSDGETWSSVDNGAYGTTRDFKYLNNKFILVEYVYLSGRLYYSDDGVSWSYTESPFYNELNTIEFINGNYIAGSDMGDVAYSTNLTSWTVTSKQSKYIAVSGTTSSDVVCILGASQALYSRDYGVKWSTLQNYTGINITKVIMNSEKTLITIGNGGHIYKGIIVPLYVTIDTEETITGKKTFSEIPILPTTTPSLDNHAIRKKYLDDNYTKTVDLGEAALLDFGKTANSISEGNHIHNGIGNFNFTSITNDVSIIFKDMIYAFDLYIAVGSYRSIYTSPDGITWTQRVYNSGSADGFVKVKYLNNIAIAVGDSGLVYVSTDGTTWNSKVKDTLSHLKDIEYIFGLYIAVGTLISDSSGYIMTTTNPSSVAWTQQTSNVASGIQSIGISSTVAVCVGTNGVITSSTNGTTWTSRTSGTSSELYSVAYGNSIFVVVGSGGVIITSPDGTTWTSRTSGVSYYLTQVSYVNNTYFIATGYQGHIGISSNGTSWTTVNSYKSVYPSRNAYYDSNLEKYIVAGGDDIYVSDNCTTWEEYSVHTTDKDIYKILSNLNRYIGIGEACYYTEAYVNYVSKEKFGNAAYKNVGETSNDVAAGNHIHANLVPLKLNAIAGESIEAQRPVCYMIGGTAERVYKCDADDANRLNCIGVSTNTTTVTAGNSIEVIIWGPYNFSTQATTLTNGYEVLVSTTQILTLTEPSAGAYSIRVGIGMGSKKMFVQPQRAVFLT